MKQYSTKSKKEIKAFVNNDESKKKSGKTQKRIKKLNIKTKEL